VSARIGVEPPERCARSTWDESYQLAISCYLGFAKPSASPPSGPAGTRFEMSVTVRTAGSASVPDSAGLRASLR
jgi:hypothetical protein